MGSGQSVRVRSARVASRNDNDDDNNGVGQKSKKTSPKHTQNPKLIRVQPYSSPKRSDSPNRDTHAGVRQGASSSRLPSTSTAENVTQGKSSIYLQGGQFSKNGPELLELIRTSVIGRDKVFSGPFGLREVTYLDYIASGRALSFIEDYIRAQVLPDYGNTHTTTSIVSKQTTSFREEARDILRKSVNASEHDCVIFVGSGCTGAIHKLIHSLALKKPPVVFVGPFEHHSNILPWKETGAEVVRVDQTDEGLVDCDHLEKQLKKWKSKGRQLVGTFAAASNVTGILTNVEKVTTVLHKHGALSFWDYATAAPYIRIDMNPPSEGKDKTLAYKDAVFFSTHKFVGGVCTPGVLIAKKSVFRNAVPHNGGGGTVFFVTRDRHRYLQDIETKEEGGTPAIVESIRAGLVFQLKEAVNPDFIMEREHALFRRARDFLEDCENLVVLGNTEVPRLPIFSFLIYHPPSGRFLHHNFVSVILNDVFGIQARGGCACAGPYGMDLLDIDEETGLKIENLMLGDSKLEKARQRGGKDYVRRSMLKPGFTRLNLPYFMDDACMDFTVKALKMVSEVGWKLLPQYEMKSESGDWKHIEFKDFPDRKELCHISYETGKMTYDVPPPVVEGAQPQDYKDCLKKAEQIFQQTEKSRMLLPDQTEWFDPEAAPSRWFLLPSEALDCIRGKPISHISHRHILLMPPKLKRRLDLTRERTVVESKVLDLDDDEDSGRGSQSDDASTDDSLPALSRFCKDEDELDNKWLLPPKTVFSSTVKACEEHQLIQSGDRVLVCVSGGRESLCLLHTIKQYQFYCKRKRIFFKFGAVIVDPETSTFDPNPIQDYLKFLGLPYTYESQRTLGRTSKQSDTRSSTDVSDTLKRSHVFTTARKRGYNVVAVTQNLDDMTESVLLSLFQYGSFSTIKAQFTVKEGNLRVIRPFVYVREKDLGGFTDIDKLPVVADGMTSRSTSSKEGEPIRQMLADQEEVYPKMFSNMVAAMKPPGVTPTKAWSKSTRRDEVHL